MSIRGQEQVGKKYDPLDTTLKFVNRKDDLDPLCKTDFLSRWTNPHFPFKASLSGSFALHELHIHCTWMLPNCVAMIHHILELIYLLFCASVSEEDDDSLRAEMSCGHAVTPDSLTQWCRSQLDEVAHVLKKHFWKRQLEVSIGVKAHLVYDLTNKSWPWAQKLPGRSWAQTIILHQWTSVLTLPPTGQSKFCHSETRTAQQYGISSLTTVNKMGYHLTKTVQVPNLQNWKYL